VTTYAVEPAEVAPPASQSWPRWWTRRRIKAFDLTDKGASLDQVAVACERSTAWVKQTRAHPAFKARLDSVLAELEANVQVYGYGNKSRRLKRLHDTATEIEQWKAEHGYTERSVRYDKDGEVVGETTRFNDAVVREERAVLHAIAEELGQLPRTGDTGSGNLVLIREVNITLPSH